jgi:hypothetical protein
MLRDDYLYVQGSHHIDPEAAYLAGDHVPLVKTFHEYLWVNAERSFSFSLQDVYDIRAILPRSEGRGLSRN